MACWESGKKISFSERRGGEYLNIVFGPKWRCLTTLDHEAVANLKLLAKPLKHKKTHATVPPR